MAAGYSQEEAEAIVGESGGLEPPFISDEPSDFTQSGVTLEDVSYMLFGADGTTIFFSADYAGEFTIEEKFLFDLNFIKFIQKEEKKRWKKERRAEC